MLFAFQDSSRQVRALFTLMFAFQGKRFNPKGCKGVYAGCKRTLLKSELRSPLLPVQPSTAVFLTSWAGRLLAPSPSLAAAPRSGRDHASSPRLPPPRWLQRTAQRSPALSYCTITADAHAKARDGRMISVWRKAMQTWRLLLLSCRDCFNPCCARLFLLQVICSFKTSLWPFYKALP